MTQREKANFIKVNELVLTQVQLIQFFRVMCVAPDASALFVWPNQQILKAFYTIITFHFKYQILYPCKVASLSCRKSTQVREGAFFFQKCVKFTQMNYFQSLRVNTFQVRSRNCRFDSIVCRCDLKVERFFLKIP